jgi:hypothetical protein
MPERLEYSGNPLPSGLPGFGGGTVSVLTLPGFNRVVAAQKFGPVNDIPSGGGGGSAPPDPEPPAGSNPENPTEEVVTPAPAPAPIGNGSSPRNFCSQCESEDDVGTSPLLYGQQLGDYCVDCSGKEKQVTRYFTTPTADDPESGVFYNAGRAELEGKNDGTGWKIYTDGSSSFVELDGATISFQRAGGPIFQSSDSDIEYRPEQLEVCVGGKTETWSVLAYRKK